MSQECVVAVYKSFDQAKEAMHALKAARFPADQVSFVTRSERDDFPREEALHYGDETERNAAQGAGVGGLIGVVVGASVLAVSGAGLVLVAGPIAMGLAGAVVGGFLGAMGGWGVHDDHIREYESRVSDGALLVIAAGDPQQVASAEQILQQTEPEEMHLHAEDSADSVDP